MQSRVASMNQIDTIKMILFFIWLGGGNGTIEFEVRVFAEDASKEQGNTKGKVNLGLVTLSAGAQLSEDARHSLTHLIKFRIRPNERAIFSNNVDTTETL